MATEQQSSIPAQFEDILHTTALAHIATIGPQGEPQSSPVWFAWDGKYVRFSNLKSRQKFRNVVRDPHIALSLTDPANPLRYLEIRGVAHIEDDPDNAFINSMAKKYMDLDVYPWGQPGDERVVIVIEPQHTTHQG